jgi:hypothetical protein
MVRIRFNYSLRYVRKEEMDTAGTSTLLPERGRSVRIGRKADNAFVRVTRKGLEALQELFPV